MGSGFLLSVYLVYFLIFPLKAVVGCCAASSVSFKKRKKRATTEFSTTIGSYEYKFSLSDSEENWNDAQARCSDLQMNLASIASREVQDYLISQATQFDGPVWIGGSDSNNEGTVEWIDNEAFSFNTPLESGANQQDKDCLAFSDTGEKLT